jgi:hypothetical protein
VQRTRSQRRKASSQRDRSGFEGTHFLLIEKPDEMTERMGAWLAASREQLRRVETVERDQLVVEGGMGLAQNTRALEEML